MSESAKLQLEYKSGCLIIRTADPEFLNRKEATFQAMGAAIKARPVKATLVDVRAVPGPVTFMDRFQLGEMAGRFLAGLNVAALAREEQADKERIGQQVARNRGASVEVFTDPAVAEAWLKKYSTPEQ